MLTKKAITSSEWLVGALLLIIAFIIVLTIQTELLKTVQGETAYDVCRGSMALKAQTKSLSPAVCKTFDKVIKPKGKTLEEQKAYVSEEILKLANLCWYETGSGMVQDIWKGVLTKEINCFICFTFTIKPTDILKRGYIITRADLQDILFSKSYVSDRTDHNCAKPGGGFCIEGETCTDPALSLKVPTTKCEKDEVCCISKNPTENCPNLGGKCKSDCSLGSDGYKNLADWSCAKGLKCCVTDQMSITYLEYIQNFEGPGSIFIQNEFKVGDQNVISLLDPSDSLLADALGYEGYTNSIFITDFSSVAGMCESR